MGLVDVLLELSLVVLSMIAVATGVSVGLQQLVRSLRDARRRVDAIAPYLLVLLVVLGLRRLALTYGPSVSWLIDINLTPLIYEFEGAAVARLQAFESPLVTDYFMASYLYGYTFLLLFPFVAYFALEETDHLRELVAADLFNYGVGLVCYVLFIAYGPRNLGISEPLLFNVRPESQLLTSQVNRNVNVFPSLHTSLSVTVAALAYRTRDEYPYWAVIAAVVATSVTVSTMYLAIHWITDVVAGVILGLAAYYVGIEAPPVRGRDVLAWVDETTRWGDRWRRLRGWLGGVLRRRDLSRSRE